MRLSLVALASVREGVTVLGPIWASAGRMQHGNGAPHHAQDFPIPDSLGVGRALSAPDVGDESTLSPRSGRFRLLEVGLLHVHLPEDFGSLMKLQAAGGNEPSL